jgi:hypothetical protein
LKPKRWNTWAIGGLLSACALVTALAVVVILVLPSRPKVLGKMTITSEGASFRHQDVVITVPPGAVSAPLELEITEITGDADLPGGALAQSSQIEIKGPLAEINGNLIVNLPIPSQWLTTDGKVPQGENLSIFVNEEVYGTSVGVIRNSRPLQTEVDYATRTMTVKLELGALHAVSVSSPHQAMLFLQRSVEDRITIKLWAAKVPPYSGGSAYHCENQSFFVYKTTSTTEADCQKWLALLDKQKEKLENLGFAQAFVSHQKPITVYLSTGMGQYQYGFCSIPKSAGYQSSYLQFNYQALDLNTINGEKMAKATAGHELFHMVQYAYNPMLRSASLPSFTVNLAEENHLKTLWSDEALSVWFEPYAVEEPLMIPGVASSNTGFYKQPLFVPSNLKADQEKGYGASFFLRYLTNKYGSGLVREMLETQLDQEIDTAISLLAWSHVMNKHNTSLKDEWDNFLETYLINPAGLGFQQFITIGETQQTMMQLKVDVDTSGEESEGLSYDKWYVHFTSNTDGLIQESNRGYVTRANEPAHAQLQIPLKNFSARTIRLTIQDNPMIMDIPGKMTIKITCRNGSQSQACPESIGMLVYLVPNGQEAPSLGQALSPADNYIWPAGENIVNWQSSTFGPKVLLQKGLVLIPFNNYVASYDDAATVIIDLYYYWFFEETQFEIRPAIPSLEDGSYDPDCDMRAADIMHGYGSDNTPEENDVYFDCLVAQKPSSLEEVDQTFLCHCITKFLREHPRYP